MSTNKEHTHHIIPLKTYFKVFGALMVLTVLTVLAAKLDLTQFLGDGPWNVILAMIIAIVKSSLVLLFFMHLYYDNRTNLLFFLGSIFFLIVFITFTYFDIAYRKDKVNPLVDSDSHIINQDASFQSLNDDVVPQKPFKGKN
tara:strand:- start:389 stop:814 length:426 start_codon:yes stop_codon:yes gene_type:complete